jgi:ubiquinone/menaquinone biosynthesis C-methylase UbiE
VSQFPDHFSTLAARYADFRPRYPKELFAYLASMCPAHELAWDCACGSGQATHDLAAHFKKVTGTDASAQQIAAATKAPNIEYRAAPAEHSGLDDESIDMITVAQALHWFKVDAFFAEARRVLKPNAIIAVWIYGATQIEGDAVDELAQDFHYNRIGPYWPPEREFVENGYATLPFPFPRVETPKFEIKTRWTLEQLIGYFSSWSGTKRYTEAKGKSPLPQLEAEMLAVWGDPGVAREIKWPITLRVGRNAM